MKKTPERIEKLAAEYVLGSLQGSARARFERWMMESYSVRQEVWYWEAHFSSLNEAVNELQPSAGVWEGISQRLWRAQAPLPDSSGGERVSRLPDRGRLWRSWSLVATAASLLLALALTLNLIEQPSAEPPLMAAITSAEQTEWIFNTGAERGQLLTRAVSAVPAAPDKDYELWVLPRSGDPVSLGIIQADGQRMVIHLTEEQRQQLLESRKLAISLEPEGGSPSGVPTGPVLHVTELLSL
ncbi:MAG: hypothetical protein CL583_14315 [Alteromonadaceae bacterium]|mgnify:CR=1 FL=1|nr:hypothetical protein [Alteromonadaceae bacterium]|tara:strand:+ start:209 stop:931 length:723 start_codon:yes stop_codon:yes gene_type:complete